MPLPLPLSIPSELGHFNDTKGCMNHSIIRSFVSVGKGINVGGVRVLEDVADETLPLGLLPLVLLVELLVVVQQGLLVQQVFIKEAVPFSC